MNELIFILHTTLIALAALGAAYLGKQALTVFVSLTFVMANILVTKQIDLFGFNVTGTDAFITGSVLALNLLNEYCGKQAAQRALTTALYSSLFVGMLATLHLWYIPNMYDTMHEHFALIFAATPRIIAASLISYFISSSFENYLYAKLKAYYEGHYVVARNFATMSCSQLLDTLLFSFLGLYGMVNNMWHIVLVSYSIKIISIIIASPLTAVATFYMKKDHEKL